MCKYKIYYKGKLSHEVEALDRLQAIKKAKRWFYDRISSGKFEGKARLMLKVDDPNEEGEFMPEFNTHLAENNFFLKKDAERILNQSNGILRYPTKKETEASSAKVGQLTQFVRTKRNRRIPQKVKGVPYLYKNYGTYFYNITSQNQKTSGTILRKGARVNVESNPRWEGDGRKVWNSKSIKENPPCIKKGTVVERHKSKLLKLEACNPYQAVCEILDKRLYMLDKSRDKEIKFQRLKDSRLEFELRDVLSFFPAFKNMQTSPILKDGLKIINNKIFYNREWLRRKINHEQDELLKILRSHLK